MFRSILVVCVGNVCRSPMAESLFKARLGEQAIAVSSAGLGALVDNPIDPSAAAVLADHGFTATEHRARQLGAEHLSGADLILVMEKRHIAGVTRLAPEARGKTFLLGKWQNDREIPDPYKQTRPAFEHAYTLIHEAVESWAARLA